LVDFSLGIENMINLYTSLFYPVFL